LSYADGRIFGDNLPHVFLSQSYISGIPEATLAPNLEYYAHSCYDFVYSADFIFFLRTVFNKNTKNLNLLTNPNPRTTNFAGETSPRSYLITPEKVRSD
jgi:hypothetical protein